MVRWVVENIYCIWLATWADHHVINDYVEVFQKLGIREFNVINSIDEHYWIFLVKCSKRMFNRLRKWALSKLGKHASLVITFQIDPAHRYFNQSLGKPLYVHSEMKKR